MLTRGRSIPDQTDTLRAAALAQRYFTVTAQTIRATMDTSETWHHFSLAPFSETRDLPPVLQLTEPGVKIKKKTRKNHGSRNRVIRRSPTTRRSEEIPRRTNTKASRRRNLRAYTRTYTRALRAIRVGGLPGPVRAKANIARAHQSPR